MHNKAHQHPFRVSSCNLRILCRVGRFQKIDFKFYDEEGEEVEVVGTGLLCLVLAGAAWTDASKSKVSNWWLLAGAAAGVWYRGKDFFPAAAAVLFLAFLLFRLGMMGAGDGKLMAVIAGYLGMEAGTEAIFSGLLVGALWSLCRLWRSKGLKKRLIFLSAYFMQIFQTGKVENNGGSRLREQPFTIPLAVCMAAGTYLYLMASGAAVLWAAR